MGLARLILGLTGLARGPHVIGSPLDTSAASRATDLAQVYTRPALTRLTRTWKGSVFGALIISRFLSIRYVRGG